MKKTRLNGFAYESNVDYWGMGGGDIIKTMSSIHDYLMSKYSIK